MEHAPADDQANRIENNEIIEAKIEAIGEWT
jgi:hypothetical protein